MVEVTAPYLQTPVFAWESRYDTDQLSGAVDEACLSNASCVNGSRGLAPLRFAEIRYSTVKQALSLQYRKSRISNAQLQAGARRR